MWFACTLTEEHPISWALKMVLACPVWLPLMLIRTEGFTSRACWMAESNNTETLPSNRRNGFSYMDNTVYSYIQQSHKNILTIVTFKRDWTVIPRTEIVCTDNYSALTWSIPDLMLKGKYWLALPGEHPITKAVNSSKLNDKTPVSDAILFAFKHPQGVQISAPIEYSKLAETNRETSGWDAVKALIACQLQGNINQ